MMPAASNTIVDESHQTSGNNNARSDKLARQPVVLCTQSAGYASRGMGKERWGFGKAEEEPEGGEGGGRDEGR